MYRLSILFPSPLGCYDYVAEELLPAGTFVQAPFGRRHQIGVVWNQKPDKHYPDEKCKPIDFTLPIPPLPTESIDFINWVANYTLSPLGAVLKMALIADLNKKSAKPLTFFPPNPQHQTVSFSTAQQGAVRELCGYMDACFHVALLDGVTGSGKTEVYFETIAKALCEKGQILVLLPEITLTTEWLRRFEKRFGTQPALWHSALTTKQRRDTWQAVQTGEAKVVVGARSALFLPFQHLQLIIVDEEHDASFKQEDGVLYQARDMAIVRAKMANSLIILASATPSLESYINAVHGRYHHVRLPERFHGARLPDIQIINMCQQHKPSNPDIRFISAQLAREIKATLERKEQTLLFINRRGYAPLVLCRACGERLQCPHCSAWLVEHRRAGYLQCHHCCYTQPRPTVCPSCQETDSLISCGPGVERIEEEITHLFPTAHIRTMDSDMLTTPKLFQNLLDDMSQGAIDILIGTQILAKGHNFANLTLVGIIDADMGLAGGDLRAGERTFQLLHQVMGRAGRETKPGRAFLQSYSPENLIIQALKNNNRETFMQEEANARALLNMPPFGRLAAIIISGKDQHRTYKTALLLAQKAPVIIGVDILGPVAAPLAVLRGKYRFRLLVKAPKNFKLQNMLSHWMQQISPPTGVTIRIDIDPYSFF